MVTNERYSRHILLSEIQQSGQEKLRQSKIAIIGCGGLGAIAGAYLAGAGVGYIVLVDGDQPDISNVHRQVFFTGAEKEEKSIALAKKLKALNPEITIESHTEYLTKDNIDDILTGVDLVLECTDTIMTKYLINDFCAIEQIPLVYGAIYKYEGYVTLFINDNDDAIHLRDIFPHPDPNVPRCADVGVYNIIAGIIGLMQANEAMKYLIHMGTTLESKLLTYNALESNQRVLKLQKNWKDDLEDLYEKTNYTDIECSNTPEIEVDNFMANRDQYILVSVMPVEEHVAIDNQTLILDDHSHLPDPVITTTKSIVLYCRSGRRSNTIGESLTSKYPTLTILSLQGGLKAYKKYAAK